jgi:carbon monoxide dehydrogenase subunit G
MIEIEKEFDVPQPLGDVWDFLVDPERIVTCLPGAKLVEAIDENTYKGEIGVRLGPIAASFLGVIHFEELDLERHHVVMTGEGKDQRGTGSVRMQMTSTLSQNDDGGTHVWVAQSVSLTGRLASFGRGGVIQSVADFMFGRFTKCVQEKLAEASGT